MGDKKSAGPLPKIERPNGVRGKKEKEIDFDLPSVPVPFSQQNGWNKLASVNLYA